MGRLDLVLGAVARRLERSRDVVLAEPVSTRALPAGSGLIVNKRTLAAYQAAGVLCLSWRSGGRMLGYSVSLLDRLACGTSVVVAAGRDAETSARALWHDVRVIRLEPGTEHLRTGLAPRIFRMSPAPGGSDLDVRDVHDLATAVSSLTEAIERQLPPPMAIGPTGAAEIANRSDEHTVDRPRIGEALRRRAIRPPIAGPAGRSDEPPTRAASPA